MANVNLANLVVIFIICILPFAIKTEAALNCSQPTLKIPAIFGARIQDVRATPVHNYTNLNIPIADNDPAFVTNVTSLGFCNVTVTYTHPGRADTVNVNIWLPLRNWNGRFQGIGGSGFAMSLGDFGMAPVVANGYAAAQTDGGHGISEADADPKVWALINPGNVNLNLLEDFASITLNELAIIGKAVTETFYSTKINYSYWNGCSTGGRQGLMLAQRYPYAFDGILASSPLVNWPKTPISTYWAQQVMRDLNYYPRLCELESVRALAIEACDGIDGVMDGVISLPSLCEFDARWTIGKQSSLCGSNSTISSEAATIANAIWAGPQSPNGKQLWHGLNRDADLMGVANTTCTGNNCTGLPFGIGAQWIQYFLAKDPNFSFANLSNEEYSRLFHLSVQEYTSLLGTDDPDLSAFHSHGGKMITVHGLADVVVPPNSTVDYYRSVLAYDKHAADYYRFFEAPGGGHCNTYAGPWPRDTIGVLERWVEQGQAPDVLGAVDPSGKVVRNLCLFPKVQRYVSGDSSKPESFSCV